MLTADEKRRINDALTTSNGNRKAASAVLNISSNRLKTIINNNDDLRAQWSQKRLAPFTTRAEPMTVVPAESEEQIRARREGEFQKLMHGTGEPEEIVHAMSLMRAYGHFSEEMESLLGGGLVERGIKLKKLCDTLDKKLHDGLNADKQPEGLTTISILYIEAHKQLSHISEVVGASRVARAKIQMFKDQAKGNKNRGKVAWGPKMQNNIVANNVQVNK